MMKGNLLIVDDEPILLKNLRANLEEYADEIFVANNGLEALEIIAKEDIHCIICDINMPKMNGVEVIKRIREQNNDVPFIFYTGHGNKELMFEAIKYGAFDFLNKPYFDGLEEVVSRGMKNGFSRNVPTDDTVEMMSEYQRLLQGLEK
jgi:two-component system nitrogen regulation response regulator NtrX